MVKKNDRTSNQRERFLFESRPRFFVHLKYTVIKLLLLLLINYFYSTILSLVASLQDFMVTLIRLPLVEATSYILLILILVLALWIVWDVISWRATYYRLSNRRVIVENGVLRKNKSYIHYNKVQDIHVSQSMLEKIFFSGDIEVFGGHERTRLKLEDVPNPAEVENMINRLIEGDDVGFEKYKKSSDRRSIVQEYDKKFKR